MPYSKNPAQYPAWMHTLLAPSTRFPLTVRYYTSDTGKPGLRQAHNMRFRVYAFVAALRAQHRHAEADIASRLVVRVDAIPGSDDGLLTVENRDDIYDPLRQALEAQALVQHQPPPAGEPQTPTPQSQPHHEDAIADWLKRGKTEG